MSNTGKYIAKINADNIVEQVIVVNSRIIRNADGTINQSKVDEVGTEFLGAGTFVGWVADGTLMNKPNADDVYDNTLKKFHSPRPNDKNGQPCTSWTINSDTMEWQSPHNCSKEGRMKIDWDEAEQKWYSLPAGGTDMTESVWNASTNAWETV
jgi:hypothetical protein